MKPEQIIKNFSDPDIEVRIKAIQGAIALIETVSEKAIATLEDDTYIIGLADNIYKLSVAIDNKLLEAFQQTSNWEAKVNLALMLCMKGQQEAIAWLFDNFQKLDIWQSLVTAKLKSKDDERLGAEIIKRLRDVSTLHKDAVVYMLETLAEIETPIPDDLTTYLYDYISEWYASQPEFDFSAVLIYLEIVKLLGRSVPAEIRQELMTQPSLALLLQHFNL